jgi:hypothetical protein
MAALAEEMYAIHVANRSYWEQGPSPTHEARADYQRRINRLEEIRREFSELRSLK